MVANYGKDCWWECQQKSGYCGFCGAGNACCREGEKDGPSECQGDIRFQTWHHECIAPVNGLVKAGAAAPKPATSAQSLVNIGKDCWWECGQKSGSCPFCGTGNACCRRGYDEDTPTECKGALAFTTWHHECVVPIHSESTELIERLAGAGAEAARLAAEKGMSQEQQVREAAMAIGKLAKAEGLSAQSAAQIAAAGAQEAAKKNGDSQLKQQELAIMAAALAATEAAQDSMPAEQKAAEIGLAVAESASAAGMSFEQQMEAASTAIGTFAADSGLSPQQAAKIAADGSRRAAKAANKDENQVAASAAAVAAAKAAGAGGKHGQELALIIAGAAAAASPGISPEEQFQVVRSALGDNAATVGLTPAELDAIAHQAVPAAKTAASPDATDPMAAGKAAASRVQSDKGTPYEEAMAAGQAAYKAAVAKPGVSVAEEVSSAHDASKKAALAAGVTAAEAETLAGAVANAVSGGAKEEIDTNVVTISPSEAAAATASQPAAESLEETPAERDAAEAGAEAARLAAAGGKSAQEQMDDAAVAAGRAAINGHMTPVGAVEAARKAATLDNGAPSSVFSTNRFDTDRLSDPSMVPPAQAARLGTEAAERAEVSGAFTAPNWRSVFGASKTDKNGAKRAVDVEDVEEPSEDETSLLEPETSPKAKGPRVPMPQRKAEAPPVPTPPPVVSVPSRASSAAVATPLPALAPVTRTAAPVYTPPTPARAPVTTYTSYTYLPQAPQPQVQAPVTRVAPLMPRTAAASLFDALDVNGDGVLDKNEFAQLETLRGQQAAPVTTMPSEPVVRTTPVESSGFVSGHVVKVDGWTAGRSSFPLMPRQRA
ncbi:Lipase [Durusdinium trenchii]|uniref:Lipase n=1 Tax=Durusdinium trenchii TaxID=1381693 RepID=A0ABP0I1S1_9DINO